MAVARLHLFERLMSSEEHNHAFGDANDFIEKFIPIRVSI
jgi:hypothetical protein